MDWVPEITMLEESGAGIMLRLTSGALVDEAVGV
jgi:hypothetical protein